MVRGFIALLLCLGLFGCDKTQPGEYGQNKRTKQIPGESADAVTEKTTPSEVSGEVNSSNANTLPSGSSAVVRLGVPVLRVEPSVVQLTPGQDQKLRFFFETSHESKEVTLDIEIRTEAQNIDVQRDEQGLLHISGLGTGEGVLEAYYGEVKAEVPFVVQLPQAIGIQFVPQVFDLEPGSSQTYRVNGLMPDGSTFDVTHLVRWNTSSNDVVDAQENNDGSLSVTAKTPGVWELNGAAMGMVERQKGHIQPYPVTGIIAEPSLIVLQPDQKIEVALLLERGGFQFDALEEEIERQETWEGVEASWDEGRFYVAALEESGEGVIRLSYQDISIDISVVIRDQQPSYLRLIAPESLEQGMSRQISVYAVYPDGSVQDVSLLADWSVEGVEGQDIAEIKVYEKKKKIEAFGTGELQLQASWSEMKVAKNIIVTPMKPRALELSTSKKNLAVRSYVQLRAQTLAQNRINQVSCDVRWTSQNPQIIKLVDQCGRFEGVAVGTSTISAEWNGLSASVSLNVEPSPMKEIVFVHKDIDMVKGQKQSLLVHGVLENGTVVALDVRDVQVQVHSAGVVQIEASEKNLVAKAIGVGSTLIKARYQEFEAQINLHVVAGKIKEIAIVPDAIEVALGNQTSLLAVGYFQDGAVRDFTQAVKWSVDDSSIVQVHQQEDGHYILNTLSTGKTILRADYEGKKAVAMVQVVDGFFVEIVIEPREQVATFDDNPETGRNVTVYGVLADGRRVDVTDQAVLQSLNPNVIEADSNVKGRFIDKGIGFGMIEARLDEFRTSARIDVRKPSEPDVVLTFEGLPDDREVEKGKIANIQWSGGIDAVSCDVRDISGKLLGTTRQGKVSVDIQEDQVFTARCENVLGESDKKHLVVDLLRDLKLTPSIVEIREGGHKQKFKAEFVHAFGPADVFWEVMAPIGEDGGYIDEKGVYTSPKKILERMNVRVKATLKTDTSKFVMGMIHINPEDTIFVRCSQGQKQFPILAEIYQMSEDSTGLPDYDQLTKIDEVCMDEYNVAVRKFTEGFPNVRDLIEWFSLKTTTKIIAPQTGIYTFTLISDDGAQLKIENRMVVDNDGLHLPQSRSGQIYLEKGQSYEVNLNYFQGPRFYIALQLFWTVPGSEQSVIVPREVFE
ncbi:MAG: PA14 domain-containing protein [Oligoflexales bacterium]